MLSECGVEVNAATVYGRVVKFEPEITKRNFGHRDGEAYEYG